MSDQHVRKYQVPLGWVLLVIWLVYLATLFPLVTGYLQLSLLTVMISLVGLVGAVLALRQRHYWVIVSSIAAIFLLIRYMIYWGGIGEKVMRDAPDINVTSVIARIVTSGIRIIEYKLSEGDIFGAFLTMANEFGMPLLQVTFLLLIALPSLKQSKRPPSAGLRGR